jgi:ACR3 family arsenite transporter
MLVHNFAVVPVVVFALASIAGDQALLAGVLLVLLAPCIDTSSYSRAGGRASYRFLAATPRPRH